MKLRKHWLKRSEQNGLNRKATVQLTTFQWWWEEKNYRILQVDGLQQQKNISVSIPLSQWQKSEVTECTGSPELHRWSMEIDQATIFQSLSAKFQGCQCGLLLCCAFWDSQVSVNCKDYCVWKSQEMPCHKFDEHLDLYRSDLLDWISAMWLTGQIIAYIWRHVSNKVDNECIYTLHILECCTLKVNIPRWSVVQRQTSANRCW